MADRILNPEDMLGLLDAMQPQQERDNAAWMNQMQIAFDTAFSVGPNVLNQMNRIGSPGEIPLWQQGLNYGDVARNAGYEGLTANALGLIGDLVEPGPGEWATAAKWAPVALGMAARVPKNANNMGDLIRMVDDLVPRSSSTGLDTIRRVEGQIDDGGAFFDDLMKNTEEYIPSNRTPTITARPADNALATGADFADAAFGEEQAYDFLYTPQAREHLTSQISGQIPDGIDPDILIGDAIERALDHTSDTYYRNLDNNILEIRGSQILAALDRGLRQALQSAVERLSQ